MRFPHWLKTVASALMLTATAGPVLAQGPVYQGTGQPMFQPAYGTNDPGVLYPQGVPQGYNPYPAISPYNMGNVAWDQTFRDDNGLWFQRIMNSNREYYFSLGATLNATADPGNAALGSPSIPIDPITQGPVGFYIPTYGQGGIPGGTTGGGGGGTTTGGDPIPVSRPIVDDRVIPYPFPTGFPLLPAPTSFGVANFFPVRNLGVFSSYSSAGLQGSWGFFNEDGSGLGVNAFWSGVGQQSFTMGQDSINGVRITQDIIANTDGQLLFTRNGIVPLDWGFSSSELIENVTAKYGAAKYDLLFHYDTETSAWGSDANYYFPTIVQKEAFKLRPLLGGRYMMIDDTFRFRGIDSGFAYGLTEVTGGGGGGGGGGSTEANTYRPDTGTLVATYDMVESTLRNNVQTNLAGAQVGLRYDFGDGDEFRVWGQSIGGLLANREDYQLNGNNIGDEMSLLLLSNLDMLATDARFSSKRSITHVSPMFEQSLNADMKILEMIPIVRNLPGVEDTIFRVGYTVTVVGQVARAGESVDWKGFPLTPSIRPGRDTWWTSKWNFGIEKRF